MLSIINPVTPEGYIGCIVGRIVGREEVVAGQKKAARTVICSCREASDATWISLNSNYGLKNSTGEDSRFR
jgi:hypothetical protein